MKIGHILLIFIAMNAMQVYTAALACAQQSPLTAEELIETTMLKSYLEALKKGDIVLSKRPEAGRSELALAMAMLAPAPLGRTVDILRRQSTAEGGPGILAIGEIKGSMSADLDNAFAKATFADQEKVEVERLMNIEPGPDFNLSFDEIAMIKNKAETVGKKGTGPSAVQAMSDAMSEVLRDRFLSYSQHGLKALAPYQIGPSEQIDPSRELIEASESMNLLRKRYPAYYNCLRYYPEQNDPQCIHQFFWAKQVEDNRPLFLLKHWILDIQPGYALITERRFYLSHSLSSLQVVIGCLPYEAGTLVVLLNQTFTEKVNMAVGGTIAKAIGYKVAEKNIRPIFENLRTALGVN
jgi:hypothetical protein